MSAKKIFFSVLATLCAWRLIDPVGSDAVLLMSYERASGLFISEGWLSWFAQRAAGITILDQVNGFLFGMMFAATFSAVSWPIRKAFALCSAKLSNFARRKNLEPEEV